MNENENPERLSASQPEETETAQPTRVITMRLRPKTPVTRDGKGWVRRLG